MAGGVLALAVAVARGYVVEACRNLLALVAVWRTVGPSPVPQMTLRESHAPRLAYAVPIGVGAVAAIWLAAH